MLTWLRHILAILLLPFMVVVVVPGWLLGGFSSLGPDWPAGGSALLWPSRAAGALVILAGLGLFVRCLWLFIKVGQGTLAPWDPTRNLVALGPYRYMRNPMIAGVLLMLAGQALFWRSWQVGVWAVLFLWFNQVYFILLEEPGLEVRFGEPYRLYKANVPRWLPRRRPWPRR